jgi:N6-L-threonylcarbamoyladenine synthase
MKTKERSSFNTKNNMYVLGIDTSFDDTAASVVSDTRILSNVLSSQLPVFQKWGGVVPRLARENHEKHIDSVINLALKQAGLTWPEIDVIAVTRGPGLAITLEIGISKAKELAKLHSKKLVAINHLEGHLLSVLAQRSNARKSHKIDEIFPSLAVIVSGGNTQFVLAQNIGEYEIIGQTQDDALGEAYDKVGRMLGLGYPAGALVEKLAKNGIVGKIIMPVPMRSVKTADTSFSGLKTAAQRAIATLKKNPEDSLTKQQICDMALAFQTASLTHLMEKLEMAISLCSPKSLILGGGVAANMTLRALMRNKANLHGLKLLMPLSKKLCVDNAAMIAVAGYFNATNGNFVTDFEALDRLPNMKLGSQPPLHSN